MMRVRLRPAPTEYELSHLYAKPHDHSRWDDHIVRADVTVAMVCGLMPRGFTVADLSCGDGYIVKSLQMTNGARLGALGDYAPGWPITGPIEQTIEHIEPVDLFVCSETIEHLDDPDAVLVKIRTKARNLLLSTPDGETSSDNIEHLWGWDSEAVGEMLRAAGWSPQIHTVLDLRPSGCEYAYQIWMCS
jgi:hypothetical protein